MFTLHGNMIENLIIHPLNQIISVLNLHQKSKRRSEDLPRHPMANNVLVNVKKKIATLRLAAVEEPKEASQRTVGIGVNVLQKDAAIKQINSTNLIPCKK
jgi:hypothetical protein